MDTVKDEPSKLSQLPLAATAPASAESQPPPPEDGSVPKDGDASAAAAASATGFTAEGMKGGYYPPPMMHMPYHPGSPYPVPPGPYPYPYQIPYGHPYIYETKREKIKRPMNSFLLFSNEQRPILQAENPDKSNAEISKLLGSKWKSMSVDKKQIYIDKAAKIKAKFHQAHPNFVYTKGPRKKKKRKSGQGSTAETSPESGSPPPSNLYYYSFAYNPYFSSSSVPGSGGPEGADGATPPSPAPTTPSHASPAVPSPTSAPVSQPSPSAPPPTPPSLAGQPSSATQASPGMPYMMYPPPFYPYPYSRMMPGQRAGEVPGTPTHPKPTQDDSPSPKQPRLSEEGDGGDSPKADKKDA
eukprot:TRINITY_DN23452_c0_g2_i2.p1 TRINITY_DN23452_c0_g2~~TRINITY_DN23452_c0_g2_i2.p1  ORF type:complete len:355 (-),score=9.02 TRINITY_DN23452_c0_g2_i2:64-1128(-)